MTRKVAQKTRKRVPVVKNPPAERPMPPKVTDKYSLLWKIGESAYLRTDPDQQERLVTGIWISEGGLRYQLSLAEEESWHYAFEMTYDRDVIKATTN